jgi:hypothetical protein
MAVPPSNPFQSTATWLAAHTRFPVSRLEHKAELMLFMAALATADAEAQQNPRFLIKTRDGAKDAALWAHQERRSHAHHKSDNSAKV